MRQQLSPELLQQIPPLPPTDAELECLTNEEAYAQEELEKEVEEEAEDSEEDQTESLFLFLFLPFFLFLFQCIGDN